MTADASFFMSAMLGVIFLVMGTVLRVFPAKKPNGFYGYRTQNAMSSPERWVFSQRYSAGLMIKGASVLILLSVVLTFTAKPFEINQVIGKLYTVFSVLVLVVLVFVKTEKELRKRFDK